MLFSVFGSLMGHFLSGFGVTFVGLVLSSFLGARVSGYGCNVACAVTCGRSFTVSSVWGVLISFLECFSVFSHAPLPFYYFYIIIVFIVFTFIRYYCYYYFHRAPGSV